MARFERLLARGGTMFAVMRDGERDVCRAVRFEPGPPDRHYDSTGGISYQVTDGARHGTEGYDYLMKRGDWKMTILGPGTQWDDGETMATGCADDVPLSYQKTYVDAFARLYFTAATCTREVKKARMAQQWFPQPTDDELGRLGDVPLAGGC